jgi:hypothetical protein
MPTQPEEETEEYELSSLDLPLVGMVRAGAVSLGSQVGKNFFLMKSQQETSMPDEDLTIEEVETEDVLPEETPDQQEEAPDFTPEDAGILKRFANLFKARTSKGHQAAITQAIKTLQDAGMNVDAEKMRKALPSFMTEGDDEEEEVEQASTSNNKKPGKKDKPMTKSAVEPTTPAVEPGVVEALVKAQITAMQDSFKAEREALAESIQKAAEAKYEAKIADLESRVEKSEVEKAAEVESRIKREYLEKAASYRALSMPVTELSELLYEAGTTLKPETYAKLEAMLKANDNLLGQSRFFQEFGTIRTPELVALDDKIAEIAKSKGIPLDEAILELSEVEQLQLMAEWENK